MKFEVGHDLDIAAVRRYRHHVAKMITSCTVGGDSEEDPLQGRHYIDDNMVVAIEAPL